MVWLPMQPGFWWIATQQFRCLVPAFLYKRIPSWVYRRFWYFLYVNIPCYFSVFFRAKQLKQNYKQSAYKII